MSHFIKYYNLAIKSKKNNRQIQLQNVINHASTHPTISMLLWNISSNITCKKK